LKETGLSYIRLNKHYVHLPYLFLGLTEALVLGVSAWLAQLLTFNLADMQNGLLLLEPDWRPIILFSLLLSCCTLSMGVYIALVREGFSSMVLRTLVSFFFLGSLSLYILGMLIGQQIIHQGLIFWGCLFQRGWLSLSVGCLSKWSIRHSLSAEW